MFKTTVCPSTSLWWLTGAMLSVSATVSAQPATSCPENQILKLTDQGAVNVDLLSYTASGANPGGMKGALNTCQWEARNNFFLKQTASSKDVFFEGSQAGSFARGEVQEGVNRTSGGFYSYLDTASQQRAIIVQPSGSFFTPGYLVLKVRYTGQPMIDQLRVNFRQYQLNDAPRSSLLRMEWVLDNHLQGDDSYTEIFADQDIEEQGQNAQFESFCESELLSGVNLMSGQTLFLRWTFDDLQGSGHRDEVGIGSVTVTTDLNDRGCQADPEGSGVASTATPGLLMPMETSQEMGNTETITVLTTTVAEETSQGILLPATTASDSVSRMATASSQAVAETPAVSSTAVITSVLLTRLSSADGQTITSAISASTGAPEIVSTPFSMASSTVRLLSSSPSNTKLPSTSVMTFAESTTPSGIASSVPSTRLTTSSYTTPVNITPSSAAMPKSHSSSFSLVSSIPGLELSNSTTSLSSALATRSQSNSMSSSNPVQPSATNPTVATSSASRVVVGGSAILLMFLLQLL
ncbi:MAG: hypothetical protein ACR2PT_10100 [Endozoicomonas sp.]